MRHSQNAVRKIYFIKNQHTWVDFISQREYDKAKCSECGLIAYQDKGSLRYFVVEPESTCAYLSCEQMIIKNIIE